MRLSFPNGDHPDVLVAEGSVHLGANVDNDILLPELRERHARLTRDARGIVLEIMDVNGRAHVNARPVREKAFVRYGDTLCLDAVTIAVSESTGSVADGVRSPSGALPQVTQRGVLRGMSGVWFGKSVALCDGLVIGLDAHGALHVSMFPQDKELARIELQAGAIALHSTEAGGSFVNGLRRESVELRSGDQLSFGRDRFVVECCSTMPRAVESVDPGPTLPAAGSVEEEPAATGSAVWWLIAAAALIGTLLAFVLATGV